MSAVLDSPEMTAAELQTPTYPHPDQDLIAGRYRLQGRIGQGRLGDIFHAIDAKPELFGDDRHFAIQIVSDVVGRSNALFNKLRIGYQTLQTANHPNIVRYGTLGRDGRNIYLFMERLEGAPLSRLLDDAGTLPLDEVLPVLSGVGDALQFLHGEDLVHGNLTAANVFITNELDVRLLDVLPSNAANTIFRGAASLNSKDRATAADDVLALACLAYRMLSGKEPFNDGNPAGTGTAGREPDRIAGLDDLQWQALRRALVPDEEQPDYPVADFLRDFGVRGAERLRSVPASPVAVEPAPRPESKPEPQPEPQLETKPEPQPERADDLPLMATRDPAPGETMQPLELDDWPDLESDAAGAKPWRAVLLTVLLAGLAAWAYFGEPEERMVDLIAWLDSSVNLGIAEPVDEFIPPASQPETPEALVADNEALEAVPAEQAAAEQPEGEQAAVEGAAVEQAVAEQAEPGQPASEPEVAAADSEPAADPETVATQQVEAAESPLTEQVAQEPAADEEEAGFAEPSVSVSEQSALVQVALPRDVVLQGPLVWWTSEHTARADADFVAVPEQLVDSAAGDTLTIQLVNDDVPEEPESFYVDVGVRQPEGQIERIASTRVDIVDDDPR